jgi:hypothetical protein
MSWSGHAAGMRKMNAYRILVGKPEGKRSLGRPRRMWVRDIKIVEGQYGVVWAGLI